MKFDRLKSKTKRLQNCLKPPGNCCMMNLSQDLWVVFNVGQYSRNLSIESPKHEIGEDTIPTSQSRRMVLYLWLYPLYRKEMME